MLAYLLLAAEEAAANPPPSDPPYVFMGYEVNPLYGWLFAGMIAVIVGIWYTMLRKKSEEAAQQ